MTTIMRIWLPRSFQSGVERGYVTFLSKFPQLYPPIQVLFILLFREMRGDHWQIPLPSISARNPAVRSVLVHLSFCLFLCLPVCICPLSCESQLDMACFWVSSLFISHFKKTVQTFFGTYLVAAWLVDVLAGSERIIIPCRISCGTLKRWVCSADFGRSEFADASDVRLNQSVRHAC